MFIYIYLKYTFIEAKKKPRIKLGIHNSAQKSSKRGMNFHYPEMFLDVSMITNKYSRANSLTSEEINYELIKAAKLKALKEKEEKELLSKQTPFYKMLHNTTRKVQDFVNYFQSPK